MGHSRSHPSRTRPRAVSLSLQAWSTSGWGTSHWNTMTTVSTTAQVNGKSLTDSDLWNQILVLHQRRNAFGIVSQILWICISKFVLFPFIIITKPKPPYGRQGLARSWGQNTDEVSTFLVFLASHYEPPELSSDWNQPGTINDNENPPRNLEKPWKPTKTMKPPWKTMET